MDILHFSSLGGEGVQFESRRIDNLGQLLSELGFVLGFRFGTRVGRVLKVVIHFSYIFNLQ
jgi:hypothetical protein